MVARKVSFWLRLGFLWLRVVLSLFLAELPLASVSEAAPTLHDTGQWSESGSEYSGSDWSYGGGAYAIHLALTRGDGSSHSNILWWNGSSPTYFFGREMGWAPVTDDCHEWPAANFTPIDVSAPLGMNLFCAGHTSLADGRLLIAGGNDSVNSIAGERGARVWQAGASQSSSNWTNANHMQEHRWYPTTTTLADGRVLVLTGIQNQKHTIFGGRLDGSIPSQSVADSVRLFEPVPTGQWMQSVIPDTVVGGDIPHKPEWRELHSVACMESYVYGPFRDHQVYFGGRSASGGALRDCWLLRRSNNLTGADFAYAWEKGPPPSPSTPTGRSEHSAVGSRGSDQSMYVFGGRDSVALSDLWQLYWTGATFAWRQPADSGSAPSPRFGHTAIYDEIPGPSNTMLHRMILFGGADAPNSPIADSSIYEMRITGPSSVSWSQMTKRQLGWGSPSARFGHAMDVDLVRTDSLNVSGTFLHGHIAMLFGGQTGANTYSKEFWLLWIFNDGTVGWEKKTYWNYDNSNGPSPRKNATLVFDPLQGREEENNGVGRAYVFGGEDASGPVDKDVYEVDIRSQAPAWFKWSQAGAKASGHTTVIQQGEFESTARVAEIYDPSSGWSTQTGNLYQRGYAPTFVTPNHGTDSCRVFSMGYDTNAYHLDVGASGSGSWTPYSHGNLGFDCESMVMYRPGLIMAATGLDSADAFVGRTMKFDTGHPDNAWMPAAPFARGGSLTPRGLHNMVIMPDGKVIAIGGLRALSHNATDRPTENPQIWDPDIEAWTDSSKLAVQEHIRDYHSTAILLPDGRILSAGGEKKPDGYYADLYSPPYLFNGDALATRPTLIAATGRWRYNRDVTFAVSGDTTIRTACLIRAPSTTHQFDQSQRYVPLGPMASSVRGDGVRQFFLKAPPDSFVAPPGDYLLFVNDAAGVPSIAQWVRVGSTYSGQFDGTAPDTLRMIVEFVNNTSIYLDWIAPGDDVNSRTALDYDIRYRTSPVVDTTFSSSTRLDSLPIPLLAGTVQHGATLTGLYPCTRYYFGGKTRDRAENWSSIGHVSAQTSTPCQIDPDDGSMRRSRDDGTSSLQTQVAATGLSRVGKFAVPASLTSGSTLRLVATYSVGEESRWIIKYQDLQGETALLAGTATQLIVQEPREEGGWADRSMLSISSGSLGVRSLLRSGRVVFPAGTALQSIETAPQSYLCTEATHSRLGDLLATASSLDSVSIEASMGDSLTLAFSVDTTSTAGQDYFFKVLVPGPVEQTRAHTQPRVPAGLGLPTEFALHSAHPNPFSRSTSLRFDLPRVSDVRIEIFDVQGRHIATLANGRLDAGRHAAEWDGSTESGGHAAAGVYLCRMKAGDFTAQKRISLLP